MLDPQIVHRLPGRAGDHVGQLDGARGRPAALQRHQHRGRLELHQALQLGERPAAGLVIRRDLVALALDRAPLLGGGAQRAADELEHLAVGLDLDVAEDGVLVDLLQREGLDGLDLALLRVEDLRARPPAPPAGSSAPRPAPWPSGRSCPSRGPGSCARRERRRSVPR